MRLLNTTTLKMKEIFEDTIQIYPYAILSHRWGNDEVSLQEFEGGENMCSEGYRKIQDCCALASSRGLDYVWIDTCCIDKKSSAELSEAINSMFRWYEGAEECYAYLNDVAWDSSGDHQALCRSQNEFRESQWFTRG